MININNKIRFPFPITNDILHHSNHFNDNIKIRMRLNMWDYQYGVFNDENKQHIYIDILSYMFTEQVEILMEIFNDYKQ